MTEPNNPGEETPPIEVTSQVTSAIVSQVGAENITEDQVALVLGAWNSIHNGAPAGTIVRNPDTGAIAHRVQHDGVMVWRVSAPNGEQWTELSPVLSGWEVLVQGTPS